MSNYPPPNNYGYGVPQSAPGCPPGAPPGGPPGYGPPGGAPGGFMPPPSYGGPPGAPPPGQAGGPSGPPASARPAGVTFFSTASGAPVPTSMAGPGAGSVPPPSGMMGGAPPPPASGMMMGPGGGGGPPMGGPPGGMMAPPPPSGYGGPGGAGGVGGGMAAPPPSMMGGPPAGPPPPSGMPGAGPGGAIPGMGGGPPAGAPPGSFYGGGAGAGGGMTSAHSMTGMPVGFDSGSNPNLGAMGQHHQAGMMAGPASMHPSAGGPVGGQPMMGGMPAGAAPGMGGAPGSVGGMGHPGGPPSAVGAGGQPGGAAVPNPATAGAPLPLLEDMDLSIQCNPAFLRPTVGKIVNSQAAATNTRIPLGLVCKPMAGDVGIENEEIEVVDFGSTGIVRCKRCRTYINPFVTWADNGRRWRCNICGMLNDVPSTYFSHLDSSGQRRDKDQRPELSRCSVEFVAPGDYMVRPPQPPVYFFLIDVSEASIVSGMIQNCVNAIKASLDDLPGGTRTQVGFITFDAHVHFYNLNANLGAPQMLIVSDVTDVILPLPEDLLVNLHDSRTVIDTLLDSMPSMFKTSSSTSSCTGPALNAAKRVIQHLGGKLLLFQSSLPTIGEGALKVRENPRLLGSDKEHTMLNAEDAWYKNNAVDFSRLQVSIDTFLFSSQYTDLATISVLSKYTAGSTYYYPSFLSARDGARFEGDLQHDLTRATAFEAVMRVRATRGIRFSNFYGNYYIRGTDLLALPNCTSDSSYSLDMSYDETVLSAQAITIQAALLYTSAAGERRIRVHTMVLPVTSSASEMVEGLDIDCAMNLLAKQAVDIAQKTGMENARQRVNQTTIEIMRASRVGGGGMNQYGQPQQQAPGSGGGGAAAGVSIPSSLLLLPLYSMSLQKSAVIRGGTDTRIDERAYFQQLLSNMDIEESKVFVYPRMFSIHDMSSDTGLPCDNADDDVPTAGPQQVRLPSILNLSYERLSSEGIFLLENGHDLFMWIGRGVNPSIISTLFGVPTLEGVDPSSLAINAESSDFSSRVDAVIRALREDRARYMQLHFIKEGDGYAEAYFARYLIEDRANFSGGGLSYTEYHAHVTRAVSGLPG